MEFCYQGAEKTRQGQKMKRTSNERFTDLSKVTFKAALAIIFMTLLASCSPQFDIPASAKISCKSSADCPSGRVCSDTIKLCVDPEELKNQPKLVGNAVVTPDVPLKVEAATTL